GADHLRNDVAGALDLNNVADAQILVANELLVVQRGESHGGAPDLHRFENRVRIQLTRASYVDFDRSETCLRNVGCKLSRDRPARLPSTDDTEVVLQPKRIDFHDAAVDREVELRAQLVFDVMSPGRYFFHRTTAQRMWRDWNAPRSQRGEQIGLGLEGKLRRIVECNGVAKEPKRARCGDGRIELSQAASGCVARVCEYRFSRGDPRLVHALELIEWKVDLAANLDAATRRVGKTQRHVAYGANVGGDVLAYGSVAARSADDEYSVLVRETHGCAVDLELRRIARSRDVFARDADEAIFPRAQLVIVERVGERKHWNRVRVLDERTLHFRTHAARRRIGAAQLRVRGFD